MPKFNPVVQENRRSSYDCARLERYQQLGPPFDLDLCYEDLSFSGKICVKTPKPRDYHALTEAVRDRLGLM